LYRRDPHALAAARRRPGGDGRPIDPNERSRADALIHHLDVERRGKGRSAVGADGDVEPALIPCEVSASASLQGVIDWPSRETALDTGGDPTSSVNVKVTWWTLEPWGIVNR
jgi:hypothetical protein